MLWPREGAWANGAGATTRVAPASSTEQTMMREIRVINNDPALLALVRRAGPERLRQLFKSTQWAA
jgi:hypothetical protein